MADEMLVKINIWWTQGEEEDVLGELDDILAELEGGAVPRWNTYIIKLNKTLWPAIMRCWHGLSTWFRPQTIMPSLPSVPTSNMEREEEELELPGVPDHQPQVELGYWDQSLTEGLDNDPVAGGEGEEEREGGIGGQLNNCY